MDKNIFDYIIFPTEKIRNKIRQEYFDTKNLQFSLSKFLSTNNYLNEIEIENKDLRELVRRVNNDIFYLTISIYNMCNYKFLCASKENGDNTYNILFRYSARLVCSEIFMYEEKIKNLFRHLYKLDLNKTLDNKKLLNEIIKIGETDGLVNDFYNVILVYNKNSAIKFVKTVRNDEIHNNSPLDEYVNTIELDCGLATTTLRQRVSNIDLYSKIQRALLELEKLKLSFQNILDNFIDKR